MASTSPGYGITIRVEGSPDVQPVALATTVITAAGATITALDVVESLLERVVIDITCDTIDSNHADEITAAISANPELTVRKVSDRTFLLHLGGKIEISSKVPLKTRDDLSRAYTPGVARICQAIVADPADARRLTIKRNTVAVVTDGSAVLGRIRGREFHLSSDPPEIETFFFFSNVSKHYFMRYAGSPTTNCGVKQHPRGISTFARMRMFFLGAGRRKSWNSWRRMMVIGQVQIIFCVTR